MIDLSNKYNIEKANYNTKYTQYYIGVQGFFCK